MAKIQERKGINPMNTYRSDWKNSIFSDGTSLFLSNQEPKIGDQVTIRLRMLTDSPVQEVFLRYIKDGCHELSPMTAAFERDGLTYYETSIEITEHVLVYQFYLIVDKQLYFYTQKGVFSYLQDETYNFKVLCDYHQPAWVKNAVFYHIFPERFCNGRPELSVKDGEYVFCGYPSLQIQDWNSRPTPYEESRCMDFFGGDLYGIIDKIPYLKDLGVTALYLNPIFMAPSVHKYDCIDFLKIDPHFGGDEALAQLSRALHEQDMKLILDISINHTGTAHRWFNRDCMFYEKSVGAYHNSDAPERDFYLIDGKNYKGWNDCPDLPVLNYRSETLRDFLYRNPDSVIRKWLKAPYSIDGWRFDVADVMAKYGPCQLSHEVWQEIRCAIREENPEAYILAEEWGDCSEYLTGKEWDSGMNYFACARLLRTFYGVEDPYFSFQPRLSGIHYHLTAKEAKDRLLSYYGKLPFVMWQNQFNLIGSHDCSRMHNHAVNPKSVKGAVIGQFTMIGAPSIYYGDEADIDGWVGSMEGCRFPMPWNSGFEAGASFSLHRKLAHLRSEHAALREGSFQILYAEDYVLAYARYDEKDLFVIILSSEDHDTTIQLPIYLVADRTMPVMETDCLGNPIRMKQLENRMLEIQIPEKENYLLHFGQSLKHGSAYREPDHSIALLKTLN